jgi:hypothetical protein
LKKEEAEKREKRHAEKLEVEKKKLQLFERYLDLQEKKS